MERAQGGLLRSIVKTTSNIRRSALVVALGGAAVAASLTPANAVPTSTWDALAQCESGGNWGISNGNGFSGGLQFTPSTWAAFGGQGSPQNASKAEQIRVAENVLAGQGWGAWPACSAKLGLYGKAGAGQQTAAPAAVAPQAQSVAPVQEAPAAPAPAALVVEEAPAAPAPVVEAPVAEAPAAPVVEAPATPAPVAEAPVAPVAAAPVAPVAAAPVANTYTVVAGDTLSEIAYAHGYNGWEALAAANADIIPNPDVIEVGQVLTLPAK